MMKKTRLLLFGGMLLLIGVPILIAQNTNTSERQYKEDEKFQVYKMYMAELNKQNLLDLPGLKLKGDKTVDAKSYEEAKKKFIQQNPDKYKKMMIVDGKYLSMPGFEPTGNEAVDAANYEKAKMEWKEANAGTYNKVISNSNNEFADIPGFKPSGNKAIDQKLYDQNKEKWAKENPETYKTLQNQLNNSKNK